MRYFYRYYPLLFLMVLAWRASDLPLRFWNGLIWSDAEGYYLYLPATFINGTFEELPVRTTDQFFFYEGSNKRFTKYTCGVAILQAPFFWVADQWVKIKGLERDGYSAFYIRSIQWAAIFYAFLGLLLLKKILSRHFTEGITFLTLLGLFFGTNLFHYAVQEPGMSHVYSFFLFALFVYLTPDFYQKPGWKRFALMGFLLGLIVLIRPTNLLLLIYLLGYGIRSRHDLRVRWRFIQRHFGPLLVAPLCSFLVFIPQFMYWKYLSGDWLIYSYGEEGFNWLSPKIDRLLFDIKNGWLLFSPMAGLSLIGLFLGFKRNEHDSRVIFTLLLVLIYIWSSWWCWWFGGAFGQRNFVEWYVLLAFPFAYLAERVFAQKYTAIQALYSLVFVAALYYGFYLCLSFTGPHYEWWEWKLVMEHLIQFKIFKP